jgi:mono/diheme cytochrome c family protein
MFLLLRSPPTGCSGLAAWRALRWIKAGEPAIRLSEATRRHRCSRKHVRRSPAEREEEAMKFIVAAAGVAAFAIVGTASGAHAQSAGDAAKGRAFAQQICSECHNIEKGQRPSPNGLAPNFETIAGTPGLTAIALTAALRTSHRTMPNIIIPDDDLRDVVAYVLSLK